MRKMVLLAALVALMALAMTAAPAMAKERNDDCDWWCQHHHDFTFNHDDCDWWCQHRDFDDFGFVGVAPFFFDNDCEWEFEEGWFWVDGRWQWGIWVLDC